MDTDKVKANATILDVARHAGVSIKSVSRVINNEPHVSERLRTKVEAAIASLDYTPDMAARSLAGSRSFTIGVLFDNPSPSYTMNILIGAYEACVEHKHHMRIDNLDSTAEPGELDRQLRELLAHSRIDGLVLTPPLTDNVRVLDFLDSRNIPYSRIAPISFPGRSPAVMMDDAAAAARVAELMWHCGHRRFGLLNGPLEHGASHSRRQGFLDRLKAFDPSIEVSEAYGGFEFEQGIAGGKSLLSGPDRPTAIFATNDDSAAGVISACGQLGLSVPDQVSICGFDDSWVAKSVWPFLTTIRQPIREMAHIAANMLLDRGPQLARQTLVKVDFELIERESVAPPGLRHGADAASGCRRD